MTTELVNPILPEFIDRLDPKFVELYTRYQAPYLRADQVSIEEYRAHPGKYTFPITPSSSVKTGSDKIYNIKVDQPEGEIKVKVYTPTESAIQAGGLKSFDGLPAHINYHGGGWVIGGLNSDEAWCTQAAQSVGIVMIDVDYRLAPEFPFPTQIWDSWSALKWVFGNAEHLGIDRSRVSIGGLSAGAHLAAVLALLARDEPSIPPLKLQLLVVPAVDHRWIPLEGSAEPSCPYKTYMSCEYAPCLPLHRMRWFSKHWLGSDLDERKRKVENWLCSPIVASSHTNLAPCSIRCAEFDVLRDEAIAYNDLLNHSGTPSRIKVYSGVCHPWGHWDGELEKAKEYVQDTFEDLKKAYAVDTHAAT